MDTSHIRHSSSLKLVPHPSLNRSLNSGHRNSGLYPKNRFSNQKEYKSKTSTLSPALQVRIAKTKICVHNLIGRCSKAERCSFAHDLDELRDPPDLYKTRLCHNFMSMSRCTKGEDCKFAHGAQELRRDPRDSRFTETSSATNISVVDEDIKNEPPFSLEDFSNKLMDISSQHDLEFLTLGAKDIASQLCVSLNKPLPDSVQGTSGFCPSDSITGIDSHFSNSDNLFLLLNAEEAKRPHSNPWGDQCLSQTSFTEEEETPLCMTQFSCPDLIGLESMLGSTESLKYR